VGIVISGAEVAIFNVGKNTKKIQEYYISDQIKEYIDPFTERRVIDNNKKAAQKSASLVVLFAKHTGRVPKAY
jgi:hypothetical protein